MVGAQVWFGAGDVTHDEALLAVAVAAAYASHVPEMAFYARGCADQRGEHAMAKLKHVARAVDRSERPTCAPLAITLLDAGHESPEFVNCFFGTLLAWRPFQVHLVSESSLSFTWCVARKSSREGAASISTCNFESEKW